MKADADLAAELIRAGASGVVVKMQAVTELPSAIEQVMLLRVYVTVGLRADRLKVH